jgi:hypothetical protein
MQSKLALNLQTSCLSLPSIGIIGMMNQTWSEILILLFKLNIKDFTMNMAHQPCDRF